MKSLRNSFFILAAFGTLILAVACQSGRKDSSVLIEDVNNTSPGDGLQSFSQIIHLYPSPAEMLSVIDMTDIKFDATLLNPVDKADQYLDSKTQTFALGMYLTDLAYSALFGRHEETLDYLEVVKSLAADININEAVDESMIEQVQNNVEFLDSLYNISNEAFINILSFCERNERSNTVVMLSAGAFAESLYLAVHMIDDYSTADQVLQHLADQKYTIDNFMRFSKGLGSDDPGVISTLNDLEAIKNIYDKIESGSGGVTIKTAVSEEKNQPKKLVIGGKGTTSQPHLTEEDFNALKAAVIELRNNAVGTN